MLAAATAVLGVMTVTSQWLASAGESWRKIMQFQKK